jgi:hypothetical protein
MPGRHRQQADPLEQDAAGGEVRFAGPENRHCGQQHVELAVPERTEARAELLLVERDLAVGVLGPESLGHLEDELAGGGADEPDPECPADAAGGRHRPVDGITDLLVGGPQLVSETATDRRHLHPAAGALEQGRADVPFQLLDRLTDPGGGHVEPLRRPAEVQLVHERQEDLDVPLVHQGSAHS